MAGLMESKHIFDMTNAANGAQVRVNGHTGVIAFTDGTTICVVPNLEPELNGEAATRIFMDMLYSVFGLSTLSGTVENLFEFFIRGFIDSVNMLLNRGLRSKYHLVSGNEKAFKGRIVFNEHIRQNFIHKERIYVEYETYSQDRPENRLIKSTLEALVRRTGDSRNKKGLKSLVAEMEEIPSSEDIDRDFGRCVSDRNMADYEGPMMWCNIFLKGMGLAGASRDNMAYSLLIDTDSLFKAYVAKMASMAREDGVYQLRYDVDIARESDSKGISVIDVKLGWTYYNRDKDLSITDAEQLYMSTPGYRVIPRTGGDRIRSMASSYLADALV
jgi:5-methylcytosine-specific restriction enzyme subunit McrC